MLIIGLTGGIGMGKSTAASILAGLGLPVYSADAAVHALLQKGGKAVKTVAKLFPEALKDGAIDRNALGKLVFSDPKGLKKLEALLHPLVRRAEQEFLKNARAGQASTVVLEIPLLFETGAEKRCDIVICVTASRKIQKERVLKRKGMTAGKFKAVLARQMSDKEKRHQADFVVKTNVSRADTKKQLIMILKTITDGK